jgi:hypothetical protein
MPGVTVLRTQERSMAGPDNDTPGAQLNQLKDDLTGFARDKVTEARDQADSLIGERKAAAADELADLSDALRGASEHLRAHSRSMVAGLAQTTADRIESLATAIREGDLPELLDEAQRFARRQPEVFFVAAVALGFLFTRALRSGRAAVLHEPDRERSARVPTPTVGL